MDRPIERARPFAETARAAVDDPCRPDARARLSPRAALFTRRSDSSVQVQLKESPAE